MNEQMEVHPLLDQSQEANTAKEAEVCKKLMQPQVIQETALRIKVSLAHITQRPISETRSHVTSESNQILKALPKILARKGKTQRNPMLNRVTPNTIVKLHYP